MSLVMILISALALVANAACVVLLRKHRHGEIHMRASRIFSTTDVQVEGGGSAVCALVVRGGVRMLKQAKAPYAEDRG